jgi:hypothetical protein
MDVTEMARLGGRARAKRLTAKDRSEIARKAVLARWRKRRRLKQKASHESGRK